MPTDFLILFSASSLKDNFRNETIITVFQGFQCEEMDRNLLYAILFFVCLIYTQDSTLQTAEP